MHIDLSSLGTKIFPPTAFYKPQVCHMNTLLTFSKNTGYGTSLFASYSTWCINAWCGKAIPVHAWTFPWGYRRLRFPEFLYSTQMKAERLSALHTGHIYPLPSGDTPGTHFWYRLRQFQCHGAKRRITSIKIPITSSRIESATFTLMEQLPTTLLCTSMCNIAI